MKSPQNTTGLCDQCQTIPLWDLPPFQLSDYTPGLEQLGKPHYLNLIRKDDVPAAAKPIGFHWHQDRGGLWQSAAGGCPLCRLVDKQARLVLSDLDGGDHFAAVMGDKPRRDNILRQVKEKFKARLRYDEKEENQDDDNVVTSMSAMMANESNVPLPRPSFDLWLTSRGSSGAGLMVFSTSIQEPGVATEKCLIPIAIIGFCSDPGDPLSEILPGRTIEAVPGPSAFAIANNCLSNMGSNPTCAPGEHVKYENLCRVFQDAIVATRRLGLRYLWIDSLCIPGGDEKAWTRDSENLAMVYRNAYLVISATGASDPSKGLFEQRTPKHYEHFSIKARSADGSYAEGNVAALSLPLQEEICGRCPELRSEPLSQRAWAFQERVLARRILHFTRDQLRFECIGGEFGMMSEDGTCSALPRFFHLPNRLEDVAQPLGPAQLRDTVTGQVPPAESTSVMQLWSIMLLWYSSLDLADPLDRLPAIAQTARAFREMVQLPDTDSDYLAGIWRSHLIDGLMWECMIDLPNIHSTEIRDGTPSWSWASVTGPVHNMLWTWGNYNLIGEILEAYTDVADPRKPFGKVTGGFIKLRAPTIAVSMVEAPFPTGKIGLQPTVVGCSSGQLQVKGASFDTIDDNFDRSAEKVRQMKLFVVFLANSLEPSRGEEVYHGLLVTLANDDDDSVLKRVGTYILTSKQVLKLGIDLDSLVQTITLV
ncbi:hypothetical protein MCOR25_000333 [Pyricularia grisea]|nr:hypothetical protein MCOR25_000333 [Pyricularia grisea]